MGKLSPLPRSLDANPAKPHYAALRQILSAHADNLAAAVDRQTR
jgi:hypothetical protein